MVGAEGVDWRRRFLDMIAWSEIGVPLLRVSDNGYDVLEGSTPEHPLLFTSYVTHPVVSMPGHTSTAAGRYQLLHMYWQPYATILRLPDFSPHSQDLIALQQVKECRAMDAVDAGDGLTAIAKCAHIWASFPGAGYKQHEQKLDDLLNVFHNGLVL